MKLIKLLKEFFPLLILYFLFLLISSYYFYDQKESKINNYTNSLKLQYSMQYKTTYENFSQLAQNTFYGIINKPEIYNIVKQAYKKDEKEQDLYRKILYKKLEADYKRLKNFDFEQLHFHFPDNTSFLRMHKVNKFGDDLTKVRFSVSEANKKLKPIEGFEIGRIEEGFRFVYPLFDKKLIHIGSVEVSVNSKFFEKKFEKNFDIDAHFLLNRKITKEKMFHYYLDNYDESFENENFFYKEFNEKIHFTNENFYTKSEKELINLKMNNAEELMLYKKIKDNYLSIFFLPIENIKGLKNAAYVVFYNDSGYIKQIYYNYYKMFFILALITIIFLSFIVYRFNELNRAKFKQTILTQQSKMAAVGEMIENIAHQWRQPLSVISVAMSGIKLKRECGILNDKDFDESVEVILKNTNYLSDTIEDFRNYFNDKQEKKHFNLQQLFPSIINMFRKDFNNQDITVYFDVKDIDLFTYESQLKQALINIIKNVQDIDESSIILIKARENKKQIKIQIQDSAGGINRKIIKKIFEPYFTTKHQSLGSGMGLFVSYEIITKVFHGQLIVENKEFEYKFKRYFGACFSIIIDKKYLGEGEVK